MKKTIAAIITAILRCTLMLVPASADSARREEQLAKFENMTHSSVHVNISSDGGYYMKSSKLYVRKVTGVNENGDFILGGWKCLDSDTNVPCGNHTINIPGTCVAFAYSCDILWGTDFPYSGVFWNDPFRDVENITISLTGLVRNVDVSIRVNGSWVYCDTNCDSHSEWKP